jgi:hypothetical protein
MGSAASRRLGSIVLPEDIGFGANPELSEPVLVPRVVVTGTYWRQLGGLIVVDGWETIPRRAGAPEHHLCVGKGALTMDAALGALHQLARLLGGKA